jgi:hypothetical protein
VLALVAVVLVAGAALGDGFRPFGIGSDDETGHAVTFRNPPSVPRPQREASEVAQTEPRVFYRRRHAGHAKGSAWITGTFTHPRLYVRYVCPDKVDGCTVGLGATRKHIDKPLNDLAGQTGSLVEKPVSSQALLKYPWLLVSKHSIRRRRFREQVILRLSAPRLLDDLAEALRQRPPG